MSDDVKEVSFKAGEVVFRQGERPHSFYLVKVGAVICLKNDDHRLTPVFTSVEGDIIGENSLIIRKGYGYSAVALEDTVLIQIESQDIHTYLDSKSDWIRNILTNIAKKSLHTDEIISEHRIIHTDLFCGNEYTEEDEANFQAILSN